MSDCVKLRAVYQKTDYQQVGLPLRSNAELIMPRKRQEKRDRVVRPGHTVLEWRENSMIPDRKDKSSLTLTDSKG